MKKKVLGSLASLVALTFFTSCATTDVRPSHVGATDVKTEVTAEGPSAQEILHYDGPKARIAVGSFEVKAGKADGAIGSGMQEMLIDSLFKTNRFIVLERASLADLQSEFELGEADWAAKAPARGTFETADILLTGSITAFEPDYKGKGGGAIAIPLPWQIGGGVKVGRTDAYIAASIRIVDIRTRRIIKTGTVEGISSSSSFGIIGGGLLGAVALGGGFQSYQNTPMEKAVMIMLENAIREIVNSIPDNYYRHTDKPEK